MSARQFTTQNNLPLYSKSLEVLELPTFAGTTMAPLDEYVQRNTADILTANKIIIGDGTNIIKDSLAEVDATGNIGIPLDQGYFINSQPILYQDNADSSKYKVEVNKVLINEPSNQIINSNTNFSQTVNFVDTSANRVYSVQDTGSDANFVMSEGAQTIAGNKTFSGSILCNDITSIGANDDIVLDANGTGKVKFQTLSNGGTVFSGGGPSNWAIEATNSNAVNSIVCGSYFSGGENRPTIGGNDSAPFTQ